MVGMRNFRMAWALTGSFWGTTWAGMVVAARAASVAIKGALISTGIGILVWGIGEAVAWCVEKFRMRRMQPRIWVRRRKKLDELARADVIISY